MSSKKKQTNPIFIDANNLRLVGEIAPLIAEGLVRPVYGLTLSEANQGEAYARLLMAQLATAEPEPDEPPPREISRRDMLGIGTWATAIATGKTKLID